MPTLARDREGQLRPVVHLRVNKDLYDAVCDEAGTRHVGALLDLLLQEWLNKRYAEKSLPPWKRPVRSEGY